MSQPSTNLRTVNLRFPGQYYDSETGFHYNGQRYYNPDIGRYLTSDLIGVKGGINTTATAGCTGYPYMELILRVLPNALDRFQQNATVSRYRSDCFQARRVGFFRGLKLHECRQPGTA